MANKKISKVNLSGESYEIDVATNLKATDILSTNKGQTSKVATVGAVQKPDGVNALFDENNKISSSYLSDTILGQLKFGGSLSVTDEDVNLTVSGLTLSINPSAALKGTFQEYLKNLENFDSSWTVKQPGMKFKTQFNYEDPAYPNGQPEWCFCCPYGPEGQGEELNVKFPASICEGYYFIAGTDLPGSYYNPQNETLTSVYTEGYPVILAEAQVGDWQVVSNGKLIKIDNTDTITHIKDSYTSLLSIEGAGLKLNKITKNNKQQVVIEGEALVGTPSGDNKDAIVNVDYLEAHTISELYDTLPIQEGTNTGSVQQKPDGAAADGINFSEYNFKAVELDPELSDMQPYGATGQYSVSFGGKSSAQGKGSVAEGTVTVAKGGFSHAEGSGTAALGSSSHAEGSQTTALRSATHAEGYMTVALNDYAHSEGYGTTAEGQAAHAEGVDTYAYEKAAHAEGIETRAEEGAHAEGYKSRAENYGAHAEGDNTKAANDAAHAEGNKTTAFGPASHVEGHITRTGVQYENGDIAGGSYAHAEGDHTVATGQSAHAEGGFINDPEYGETFGTAREPKTHIAPDTKSEREIYGPFAAGVAAHAEGIQTLAYGYASHAQGFQTEANSRVSHAEGSGVISGGYGWRIIGPTDANAWKNGTNTITIYDPRKTFLTGEGCVTLPSTDAAKKSAEGYICSVKLNSNYDLCGYIMSIDSSKYDSAQELTITLDVKITDTVGLTANVGLNDKANDQNTLRVFKGYIRDITAPSETTQHNNAIREVKGGTICVGTGAHAEGLNSMAFALAAHAEGRDTKALGTYSHAEGRSTLAVWGAHSEGQYTYAIGLSSHAEGRATRASGDSAHSEGVYTTAANSGAHAEGSSTQALALYGHAEGQGSKVETSGTAAHAEGGYTQAKGVYSHSEGYKTGTGGHGAHAEGTGIKDGNPLTDYDEKTINGKSFIGPFADGRGSHAEGAQTWAGGYASHSEGIQTEARSIGSHAEGYSTLAGGLNGDKKYAHAEGWSTKAQGDAAHAEGKNTLADSEGAHAEGSDGGKTMTNILRPEGTLYNGLTVTGPTAWSKGCHAEGICTFAASEGSHAEGIQTQAVGYASHSGGIGTRADKQAQTVVGQYNAADNNARFIVGYGTGMENENRFNCFSTGKNNAGQAYITVGATTLTEGLLRNIFAGTDSPSATIGQDGDIYIQYTN